MLWLMLDVTLLLELTMNCFISANLMLNHLIFMEQERLVISDMAIASCEFMFEETRNYVMQRKAFSRTVAHLQVCITRFYTRWPSNLIYSLQD